MREFAKTLHFRSICCSSSELSGTNSKILSFQELHWRELSQTDVNVVKKVKSDGVPAVSFLPRALPTLLFTLPHLLLPAKSLQPQGRRILSETVYRVPLQYPCIHRYKTMSLHLSVYEVIRQIFVAFSLI